MNVRWLKLTKYNRSPEVLDLKNIGSDVRFSEDRQEECYQIKLACESSIYTDIFFFTYTLMWIVGKVIYKADGLKFVNVRRKKTYIKVKYSI